MGERRECGNNRPVLRVCTDEEYDVLVNTATAYLDRLVIREREQLKVNLTEQIRMAAGKQKEGSKSSHSQGKTSVDMKKPDDWMYKYQNDVAESRCTLCPCCQNRIIYLCLLSVRERVSYL